MVMYKMYGGLGVGSKLGRTLIVNDNWAFSHRRGVYDCCNMAKYN